MSQQSADLGVPDPSDLAPVDDILKAFPEKKGMLIPILQGVQDVYGFVPEGVANNVADEMGVYRSQVYGILTFYTQFHLSPRGRQTIRACAGTACHVKGGKQVILRMEGELGVGHGGTTEDGLFSFEHVACIGACGLAPVIMVDDDAFGHLDPNKAESVIKKLRREALKEIGGADTGEQSSGDENTEE